MHTSMTRKLAAAGIAAAGAVGLVGGASAPSSAVSTPTIPIPNISLPSNVLPTNIPNLVGSKLSKNQKAREVLAGVEGIVNLGGCKIQGKLNSSKLQGLITIFRQSTNCPTGLPQA